MDLTALKLKTEVDEDIREEDASDEVSHVSRIKTGQGPHETVRSDGNGGTGRPSTETAREQLRALDEYAADLPPGYLSVLRDSVPYYLRVASLKQDGLPDIVVDTAEARGLPYLAPGSEDRKHFDEILERAVALGDSD